MENINPLLSIRQASKLDIIKNAKITIPALTILIKSKRIYSIELTKPGSKYETLRTTEKWIYDYLKKEGIIV